MVDFDWRSRIQRSESEPAPPASVPKGTGGGPAAFSTEGLEQEPVETGKNKVQFDWRSRIAKTTEEPPLTEKLKAGGKGLATGAIEMGPIAGGAFMGFQAGAPFGPAGALGGMVIGGLGGYFLGQAGKDVAADFGIAAENLDDIPPELRSSFVLGETIGGGVAMAAAPAAAAWRGARLAENVVGGRVSGYINRMLDGIRAAPGAFATTELGTSITAGIGGYWAEELFPGNPFARAGAETTFGFVNPAALIARASPAAWTLAKRLTKVGTKAGRQAEAARVLQEAVQQAGEDPAEVARMLENLDLSGPQLTMGMRAPSPALKKIEAELVATSKSYGAKHGEMAEKGLLFLRKTIDDLRNVGSVEALRGAAQVRKDYYNSILTSKLGLVEQEAVESVRKITEGAIPAGMSKQRALISLNRQTYNKMDEVLNEARVIESQLWNKVPKTLNVQARNVFETWGTLSGQFTERFARRRLNFIRQEMKDLAGENGVTTSGKLIQLRSSLLEEARIARANKQYNVARVYNQMSEAILKDLEAADDLVTAPALTDARLFSRELNDVFTRSFVGDALAKDRIGAERMLPEEILDKAFGSGGVIGLSNMNDIEAATRFLSARGIGGTEQLGRIRDINNYQEAILRISAAEAVDFKTGHVNVRKLSKFLEDNDVLLERFPEVRAHLKAAMASEQARADFARYATGRMRFLDKQHSLAKLTKFDSPANALRSARRDPRAVHEVGRLMRQAKRLGADAVQGMRATIMEDAIRNAERAKSEADYFRLLKEHLFNDMAPGVKESVMDSAMKNGIMSKGHVNDVKDIIDKAENIVASIRAGEASLIDTGQLTVLEDVLLRILGAKAGRALEQTLPGVQGHGLIAEAAGSKAIRTLFTGVTDVRIRGLIEEATMNRDLAVKLLRQPTSATERARLGRQVHAYMQFAGINLLDETTGEEANGGED